MEKPKARALGIIRRGGARAACFSPAPLQILVQCDDAESFYRLPGGTIEHGETAAQAVVRELAEEFDLEAVAGPLAAVDENFFQEGGRLWHEVNLIHWCQVPDADDLPDVLRHNEVQGGKAVWRTLAQLRAHTFYPPGLLDLLERDDPTAPMVHLVSRA
jgi:ADP-ribose pyrophosphatase YjhB (NUDIX family)